MASPLSSPRSLLELHRLLIGCDRYCTGVSTAIPSAWSRSSCRDERHGLDDVVVIAGRIGDQGRCLALANLVRSARHDYVLASRSRRKPITPGAKRELAEIILPQRRGGPCLPAVDRRLHRADAVAAVPRDPGHDDIGAD